MRFACVIVQPICDEAVAMLRGAGLSVRVAPGTAFDTLAPLLSDAHAVITRNHGLSRREIEAAPLLRVIGVHGTGVDPVDREAVASRGIALVNTPGANAQSVAELALGLMLACARALVDADRAARRGDYGFRQARRSYELSGRRLGLVGYGHIAQRLARFAAALGMEVGAFSRHTSASALAAQGIVALPDLDALCAWADVVSLHAVPGPAPVIDARRLRLIGSGGMLINTARGALVDEAALAAALRDGTVAAAGLDVLAGEPPGPDNPLLACPNLVLTPHVGGSTVQALDRTGREVAAKVLDALRRIDGGQRHGG